MMLPRTRRLAARDNADAATVTLQRRRSKSIYRDFERLGVQHRWMFHRYDELVAALTGDPAVVIRCLAVRWLDRIGRRDGVAGRDNDAARLALLFEQPLDCRQRRRLVLAFLITERQIAT